MSECDHPWHENPGLITPCPACGEGSREVASRTFALVWREVGSEQTFEEIHRVWTDDPRRWSEETLEWFNDTLKSGEPPRELMAVYYVPPDRAPPRKHVWEKTNLFTLRRGKAIYDTYRCEVCGERSKRFGIGGDYVLDDRRKRGQPCPGDGREFAPRVRRRR